MISTLSLLLIVFLSILLTRIATVALTHTGLSRQSARFQARSALTGVGFTTTESEKIVNHPVRRRIVLLLMLIGNAGIITAVSSLIITFVRPEGVVSPVLKIVVLIAGVSLLWTFAASNFVDHHLWRLINWGLRRYTRLDVKDYASLMNLSGEYQLMEFIVSSDDWIAERRLGEAELWDEGIIVLGIHRPDGTYLGAPRGDTTIYPTDRLVVYGRESALESLDNRRKDAGEREHEEAVKEQETVEQVEKQKDRKSET